MTLKVSSQLRRLIRATSVVGSAAALAVALTSCALFEAPPQTTGAAHSAPATSTPDNYVAPSADVIAALPEAKYDAVIPGLLPDARTSLASSGAATNGPAPASTQPGSANPASGASPVGATAQPSTMGAGGATDSTGGSSSTNGGTSATVVTGASYHLGADAPLYGADRVTPVARLAATNFLGDPTVVVPVQIDGPWALVLTPSRQARPSENNGNAPAQTAAWIRTSLLTKDTDLASRIVVSLGAQTLTISTPGQPDQTFAVGVGAPDTPTPTGVTGYIQARYLDPSQGESVYPIQLTSLHSAVADEPYGGGSDGGLIGVHFEEENTGQISHGCIRLPADAITAVNNLPLGTLITITP